MNNSNQTLKVKILTLGESGAGKSAIILRFTED